MPTCSVGGCTKEKRYKIDPDHKFFTFPRTSPLVEKWIKFCRKDSLTKEKCMAKGAKVCSIHFKEDCIEIPLKYRLLPQFTPKNMRILRKDAVPTIRNPKKKKEDEKDEKEQRQKKEEYSRIVAELLEQSEKDAAAERERQEKEKGGAEKGEAIPQTNMKLEEVSPGKKTPKSKKTQPSKQKSPKKMKTESSPDIKQQKSNKKTEQKKNVTFARGTSDRLNEHVNSDDDTENYEPDCQSEDLDNETAANNPAQHSEDTAAELLRLQRENKKLTDLTIKQSMQIADLIKQRNDLWREKGDLWFRKRVEQPTARTDQPAGS